MALPIEGFSVVAQLERIQPLLDRNAVTIPNATALSDAHLWKCSFMAQADAQKFLTLLEKTGFVRNYCQVISMLSLNYTDLGQ